MARQKAMFALARMNLNTSMALSMRARCVEWTRSVPVLSGQATSLPLQQGSTDQVSLLDSHQAQKSWVSFKDRIGAQGRCLELDEFGVDLTRKVRLVLDQSGDEGQLREVSPKRVMDSMAALRGIAGMKFCDAGKLLIPSPSEVRLVYSDPSILIASTSLISQPQLEKTATAWIRSTAELTDEGWDQKL